MAKYLLVYHGGGMPEGEAEQGEVMAAWGAWLGGLGDDAVDGGNPVGGSVTMQPDGSVRADGGANPVSGYSIVAAESDTAVQVIARECPHLASGGSIEIAPIMEM